MDGLRTQLHKKYKGQFINIKYKTLSNNDVKYYHCKLEGREKNPDNKKDFTGDDNIVIKIYNKKGLKKIKQLIPERILSIKGQGHVVIPSYYKRLQLNSLQKIS